MPTNNLGCFYIRNFGKVLTLLIGLIITFRKNIAKPTRMVDEFQKSQNAVPILKVADILMTQIKFYQIYTQPRLETLGFNSFSSLSKKVKYLLCQVKYNWI